MDYLDRCPKCRELVTVIPEWREEEGMLVIQQSRCFLCKIKWRDRFISMHMFFHPTVRKDNSAKRGA